MNRVALAADLELTLNHARPVQTSQLEIASQMGICDPLGALFLPDLKLLVVSDLHLEKGAAFARRGMMLPPYDTELTLCLLKTVVDRYRPETVVSLGDSFHDRRGAAEMPGAYRQKLIEIIGKTEWIWITGNHDPDVPDDLPGTTTDEAWISGLCFRHEPRMNCDAGEIAGHLHPSARVVRHGKSVKRPCFATDGHRLLMPAFGVMTGGLDLRHPAVRPLFDHADLTAHLLGKTRTYAVHFSNLVK